MNINLEDLTLADEPLTNLGQHKLGMIYASQGPFESMGMRVYG
jgi:hypothetical protein